MSLYSQNYPFASRNYPFVFRNYPFVSRKCLFYLLCACLFPRMYFNCWLYLVLLRAGQRDNIHLALVSFPIGTLYWPTYDGFLIMLKSLHRIWFFMYFIYTSASMIAWKMHFWAFRLAETSCCIANYLRQCKSKVSLN